MHIIIWLGKCVWGIENSISNMRMSPEQFDQILSLIEPIVTKESTNFRESISGGERLSITLWFLATGETQQSVLSLQNRKSNRQQNRKRNI